MRVQYGCLYYEAHSSIPAAVRLYIFQHCIAVHSQPLTLGKSIQVNTSRVTSSSSSWLTLHVLFLD